MAATALLNGIVEMQKVFMLVEGKPIPAKQVVRYDGDDLPVMPLADMFWGDRMGTLTDPFGNRWSLAQHMKDMTPDEMKKAEADFVAAMAKKK